MRERKPQSRISRVVFNIIIVICLVSIAVFGYQIITILQDYHKDQSSFKDLRETILVQKPQDTTRTPNTSGTEIPGGTATENPALTSETDLEVDFLKLQQINPDSIGWLEVPGTNINYPILKGSNNNSYLRKNIYGDYSEAGSIFIDSDNQSDFMSQHTIIYGHNMLDGNMFAQLAKYSESDFFDKNRTIYIYTPEKTYQYLIFNFEKVTTKNLIYQIGFSDESAFADWQKKQFKTENPEQRILTLSTCTNRVEEDRFVISALPIDNG